jgi:hypothetical protein
MSGPTMSASIKTTLRWDATTNIATFHFTDSEPFSVHMHSFEEAHALSSAIQHELRLARYTARMEVLNDIGRIRP